MVQSASTSGGQRCAAPREVGGINDVTVSNRVNLVDPICVSARVRVLALARQGHVLHARVNVEATRVTSSLLAFVCQVSCDLYCMCHAAMLIIFLQARSN